MLKSWIVAIAIPLLATGCQCCRCLDNYGDAIDCISESSPKFDDCYDPRFDVSRIGQPDWCECGFNRWWCGCRCEPGCPQCE